MIFSRACCTLSPEVAWTRAASPGRALSLSISSMKTMPRPARSVSPPAFSSRRSRMASISSPTYLVWAREVASVVTKGTCRKRERVSHSRVLPVPVGPMMRTLLLSRRTVSPAAVSLR